MNTLKAFFVAVLLCVTAGCGTPTATTPTATVSSTSTSTVVTPPPVPAQPNPGIELILSSGAELATDFGLKALPAADGTLAATSTVAAITAIQTTLGGSNAGDSAAITALLSTKLLSGVSSFDTVIQSAMSTLLAYLPTPTVGQYLSPTQMGYVTAFLTGVSKGCTDFLAAPTAAVKSPVYRQILAARALKK